MLKMSFTNKKGLFKSVKLIATITFESWPYNNIYDLFFIKWSTKHSLKCVYVAFQGLHDDSANDDSAIDKMAARFWHTDDSATFLFEKKGQIYFPTPHGFSLKDFSYPSRVPERTYTTPHGVFLTPGGSWFLV